MTSLRVDVHHHMVPPDYVAALEGLAISEVGGVPFPKWSPQKSLATMDKNGIASAVLSISTPGVYFGEVRPARDLARRCNEYAARTVADHPHRFGALASLPLPDVEGALRELEYALDELELDGVVLLSSVEGRYPGDPDYREIFDELEKRRAVVFIHPSFDDPPNVDLSRLGVSNALIEAPFDTTRAVASLLYEGVLERIQNVPFILAHGGGTVPYLAWRIALQYYAQREKKHVYQAVRDFLVLRKGPEEGIDLLRALYYEPFTTTRPWPPTRWRSACSPSS